MSEHAMGKVASGERGSPRRIGRSIGAVLAGMVVSPHWYPAARSS